MGGESCIDEKEIGGAEMCAMEKGGDLVQEASLFVGKTKSKGGYLAWERKHRVRLA